MEENIKNNLFLLHNWIQSCPIIFSVFKQNKEFTSHLQQDTVIILFSLSKRNFWGKEKVGWLNHNKKVPFNLPNTKDSAHHNFIAQIYSQQPWSHFCYVLPSVAESHSCSYEQIKLNLFVKRMVPRLCAID